MVKGLTGRQAEVMDFLRLYVKEHGYPPTMREIAGRFGFTWPAARGHLAALGKKGYIRLRPLKSRAIEILPPPARGIGLPVAGTIRAGRPIPAVQDIGGRIVVDEELFGAGAFALRTTGESMVEAGIFDGDYVVVMPGAELREGDAGVFLVSGEATVKKFSAKGGVVTLIPANGAMSPVAYGPDEITAIGRVVGVIRKL